MRIKTVKAKFIVLLIGLSFLSPIAIAAETTQVDDDAEGSLDAYDLNIRNIAAFSKIVDLDESEHFDYLCGRSDAAGQNVGDNCMANDVHMILFRTSLQNTKFDLRQITVKNIGDPDDVDLEIYVCYRVREMDAYPNQMDCMKRYEDEEKTDRFWESGDTMTMSTNSHRSEELFVYLRAWDNNGNDGDRTRISVQIEVLDDYRANSDHNEPRTLTLGTIFNDEVCRKDCDILANQDYQDGYNFSFYKGDSFDIQFWPTECESSTGDVDRQISVRLELWRVSTPMDSTNFYWKLNEQGCDQNDHFHHFELADADEPGWLIVRFSARNVDDYDPSSYTVKLATHDTSQRDSNHDFDGDGWSDVNEVGCSTNFLLSSDVPSDIDGDGLCDIVDSDDDNDGVVDDEDACPTFYNADETNQEDHDGDGCADEDDPDDDNDGKVDLDDLCPRGSPNTASTPTSDFDEDGCLNNEDSDDDDDGWDDATENACNTNPLDALDIPVNTDGDEQCDYLDADDDNDGVPDTQDQFPKDEDEYKDSDADGIGDEADLDDDNDGVEDLIDHYPYDPTQSSDRDGDGCGDNRDGTNGDHFPVDSSQCLDYDDDGYGDNPNGNNPDIFPYDSTQWRDRDGDGYGDNLDGANPDLFPNDSTQWRDSDGDGYGDNPNGNNSDAFPNEFSQWKDSDGDRYGDNAWGVKPDGCPSDFGTSYLDLFGCPDDDSDGTSNSNDDCPNAFGQSRFDRKGCIDSDEDGYSDPTSSWLSHPEGLADALPYEITQWFDIDGDGYGDNQNGNNPDRCSTEKGTSTFDRWGCIDEDGDGWSDQNDAFPIDGTQWSDKDGDGFGDNQESALNNGDACPDEAGNTTEPERLGCPPLPDKDGDGIPDDDDLCDKHGMNEIQKRDNTCWGAILAGEADWKTQGAMILFFIPLIFTLVFAPLFFRRQH